MVSVIRTRKYSTLDGQFTIEVRQDSNTHRTQLYVYDGNEEILRIPCVHVVITTTFAQLEAAESLDDLINIDQENRYGNEPAKQVKISDDDIFWAHCSNIEYWLEEGMPPEGLASNLSVPILKAIASRNAQFASQLTFVMEDLVNKSPSSRKIVILERYGALLPGFWWDEHPQFIEIVNPEILLGPARDSHSPLTLLEKLACHPDPRVRNAIATNRTISPSIARYLAKDPFMEVRYALARNPNTPPDVLIDFAQYRHILMRESVARNPSAPLEALSILFENSGWHLQQTILENPACTPGFLEKIITSTPSNTIKQIALAKLEILSRKKA